MPESQSEAFTDVPPTSHPLIKETPAYRWYKGPYGNYRVRKTREEIDEWNKLGREAEMLHRAEAVTKRRARKMQELKVHNGQKIARHYIKNDFNVAKTARELQLPPSKVRLTLPGQLGYIKSYLAGHQLDDKAIVAQLQDLILRGKNESAKVRAIELVGKHLGMWKEVKPGDEGDLSKRPMEELLAGYQDTLNELKKALGKGKGEVQDAEFKEGK